MGWWMWLVMGGGALGFWVVIVLVIRALLPAGRVRQESTRTDPLNLLKESLARGEVSLEEYEQRRRLIVDGH
jgi:putative membrane protein